jgi:hypothetical protein
MNDMTPDAFRALLQRGRLTGAAAARLAGVNPRTVRRWIGGESEIPYSAWRIIETHVEKAEIVAEADYATWAKLAALDERIWRLRGILTIKEQGYARLERDLDEAREALAETKRQLMTLLEQREELTCAPPC